MHKIRIIARNCLICNDECVAINPDGLCDICHKEAEADGDKIIALENYGHTTHCAWRQIYGDGQCECNLA